MTSQKPPFWSLQDVWRIGWPALAIMALCCPFFALDADVKLAIYAGTEPGPGAPLISWLQAVFILVFLGVTLSYLVGAFRILGRHVQTIRQFFSNIEDRSLNWLRWVLALMLAAWIWGAVKGLIAAPMVDPALLDAVSAVVELAWVITIGFFGIRQEWAYAPQMDQAEPSAPAPEPMVPRKYDRSALDPERQAVIRERLDRVMAEQALYSNPLLSLPKLAAHINVSQNHLSQTLNETVGLNFFDYVNKFRVEEAVRRIQKSDDLILTIALDVGFNSRSTFNAAVKKHTGKAPSDFRRK